MRLGYLQPTVPPVRRCRPKTKIGDFDAELARSSCAPWLSMLALTMHITLMDGSNVHHMLEAIFKAVGERWRKPLPLTREFTGFTRPKAHCRRYQK